MADGEFYRDERGDGWRGVWYLRPGGDIVVGGWDSGSGSGDPGGTWDGRSGTFAPAAAPAALNLTAGGALLVDADGALLTCAQLCVEIPALIIYISGEDTRPHADCVLCRTTDPARPVRVLPYSGFDGKADTPAAVGFWPAGTPGTYKLRAKWQSGHYDYAKIRHVKFVVYGVSTGWETVPLSSWTDVATITISDTGGIIVDGQPGSLRSNKSILESLSCKQ